MASQGLSWKHASPSRRKILSLSIALMTIFLTTGSAPPTVSESPVVFEGRIIAAGRWVDGATVGLYLDTTPAHPSDSPLIASAVTDVAGTVELRADNTDTISTRAAENDGQANFYIEVITPDGSLVLSYYFSRTFSDGTWRGGSVTHIPVLTLERDAPGVVRVPRHLGRALALVTMDPPDVCGGTAWITQSTSTAWTDVGEYHTVGGMSGWFQYARNNSADSDIGVGISGNASGPWSLSGSVHIGTSNSSTETWNRGPNWSRRVRTQFQYAKQRQYTGCGQPLNNWRVKATQFAGGAQDGTSEASLDHQCDIAPYNGWDAPHAAGTAYDRTTVDALTWNAGVSVFGATLSTQSGYSTSVQAHWAFSSAGVLCGSNTFVPSAKRIWAGT